MARTYVETTAASPRSPYPDSPVVTCAGETLWIRGIPRDGVNAALVRVQHLDGQAVGVIAPDVDSAICLELAAYAIIYKRRAHHLPSLPLTTKFSSAPPNELLMMKFSCTWPSNRWISLPVSISKSRILFLFIETSMCCESLLIVTLVSLTWLKNHSKSMTLDRKSYTWTLSSSKTTRRLPSGEMAKSLTRMLSLEREVNAWTRWPSRSQMQQPNFVSCEPITTCVPEGAHAAVVQG